jgi:ABC-type transport system involved in multi-copper enzyme maturation permease subunit
MHAILAIARADFRERVRRSSFLLVLLATVAASYAFVPARSAGYVTMGFGGYGGIYNTAWVGTMVAVLVVTMLSLLGFYLVRDAIERDERTGVGQILATTPMTRMQYTLGKFLSHVAVLACVAAVTTVMAAVMQELRGEVRRIEPFQLVLPFLVVVLPALLVVAALAVVFESLRWLRGAPGSVLYFFVWIALFSVPVASVAGNGRYRPYLDPLGWASPASQIQETVHERFPEYRGDFVLGGDISRRPVHTFVWQGLDGMRDLGWRFLWALVAVGLAAAAALPFHRFDPERMPRRSGGERASTARSTGRGRRAWRRLGERLAGRSRTLTLVRAEMALLLRSRRRGWGWVALGLWLACLFAPIAAVRHVLLPLAWVWPLPAWSSMGSQEARHRAETLVFACPRPLARQLPAAYLAGVLLTALLGSGAALHLTSARAWGELGAWGVGTLFVPALALAAGVISGGPRLFEVTYLLVWYLGLLNGLPVFDFLAPTAGARTGFLAATLCLLVLAFAGRARRLRR